MLLIFKSEMMKPANHYGLFFRTTTLNQFFVHLKLLLIFSLKPITNIKATMTKPIRLNKKVKTNINEKLRHKTQTSMMSNCVICNRPVRVKMHAFSIQAVCCDMCQSWTHRTCCNGKYKILIYMLLFLFLTLLWMVRNKW